MNFRKFSLVLPMLATGAIGWLGGSYFSFSETAQAQAPAQGPRPDTQPSPNEPLGPMGGVVKWIFPDSIDSVNAAPKNHHVLYEDDHIRLLTVIIQPGETENMHGHKYPSVFFRDTPRPAQFNVAQAPDGKPGMKSEQPRTGEDSVFPTAFSMATGQRPHQTTITDKFPDMFYRVEFKRILGKSIETMASYPYPPYPQK